MGRPIKSESQLAKVGRLVTGFEIYDRRRRAGLSIAELSILTDIPVETIERIESGGGLTVAQNTAIKEVLMVWKQKFHLDPLAASASDNGLVPARRGRGSM